MGTNALHGRNRSAQGAKAKADEMSGETLQRSDGRLRQQPEGNGRPAAPLCVVLLAKTSRLRFVVRLDWCRMTPVRVCAHSVNRPLELLGVGADFAIPALEQAFAFCGLAVLREVVVDELDVGRLGRQRRHGCSDV